MINMKREIKFRAWLENKKEMYYQYDNTASAMNGLSRFAEVVGSQVGYTPEVMQYTGLKNKNGKEIYEKDSREEYSFIDFCSKCMSYQEFYPYKGKNICHNCDGNYNLSEIDFSKENIIGNIYENPELIK